MRTCEGNKASYTLNFKYSRTVNNRLNRPKTGRLSKVENKTKQNKI